MPKRRARPAACGELMAKEEQEEEGWLSWLSDWWRPRQVSCSRALAEWRANQAGGSPREPAVDRFSLVTGLAFFLFLVIVMGSLGAFLKEPRGLQRAGGELGRFDPVVLDGFGLDWIGLLLHL